MNARELLPWLAEVLPERIGSKAMSADQRKEGEATSRQDVQRDLVEQARRMPEVADAIRAYEALGENAKIRLPYAVAKTRYATGGNA